MDIISGIVTLVSSLVNGFTDKQKAELTLALQQDQNIALLMQAQLKVNEAEANASNRKWVTWRELLGYALVLAVAGQYVLFPYLTYFCVLFGHAPIAVPQFDIVDILYILMGMLGLEAGPMMTGKVKGLFKKNG